MAEILCSRRDRFRASENEGDWLGFGSYFFEDAPDRAMYWAKRNCPSGETPAVIRAQINLSKCLDFLDLSDFYLLKQYAAYAESELVNLQQEVLEVRMGRTRPPKEGTPLKMRNKKDKFIIDYCVESLRDVRNINTVRAPFLWGHAAFRESCIFDWSRVEIAVRQLDEAIESLALHAVGT